MDFDSIMRRFESYYSNKTKRACNSMVEYSLDKREVGSSNLPWLSLNLSYSILKNKEKTRKVCKCILCFRINSKFYLVIKIINTSLKYIKKLRRNSILR